MERLEIVAWSLQACLINNYKVIKQLKESVNIAVITETKNKLRGTKDLDNFVMI